MNIAKAPYRCPPGPYERACVVADYIKRKKSSGTVIVADANPGITAEPVNFGNAFNKTFKGIVRYIPNCQVLSVDSTAGTFNTSRGTLLGKAVNYLPDTKAPDWLVAGGLIEQGARWAAVDPLCYASLNYPDIHILGDAQATSQPKSGTKVCADAIVRALRGQSPNQTPVTMSACYSPMTSNSASWLTASFQYDPATKNMKRVDVSFAKAPAPSAKNLEQMFRWAKSLFADSFA